MCMAAIIAAMTAVIESERSRLEDEEEEEEERERKKRECNDLDDDDQYRYYITYIHNTHHILIYNDCYTYTS